MLVGGLHLVGWHELVALPKLDIDRVYAKLDTGADRCSLHARDVRVSPDESQVEFSAPLQRKQRHCGSFLEGGFRRVRCDISEMRFVRSSNGQDQRRPVIRTPMKLGSTQFDVLLSLTDRDHMRFCMLLGRDALSGRFLVDPARAHLLEDDQTQQNCPD